MALGRPPLGRRALLAATLGAIYGLLLLPAPETPLGLSLPGVGWFFLSVGLLFLTPLAYYVFSVWAVLWIAWKGVAYSRQFPGALPVALDVGIPLAALLLLTASRYLARARAWAARDDGAAPVSRP